MSKLTVHLEHDDQRPDFIGWKLYSFNRKHVNFKHPSDLGLGPLDEFGDPKVEKPALARKLNNGTAFILSYYEHGSSIWFLRGDCVPGVEFQWDGVRIAGLLIRDAGKKNTPTEEMEQDARTFLKAYTAWANGQIYCYRIEDEGGNAIDSCGGFTDQEEMFGVIASFIKGHEVEFVGDAKWLAQGREQKCQPPQN